MSTLSQTIERSKKVRIYRICSKWHQRGEPSSFGDDLTGPGDPVPTVHREFNTQLAINSGGQGRHVADDCRSVTATRQRRPPTHGRPDDACTEQRLRHNVVSGVGDSALMTLYTHPDQRSAATNDERQWRPTADATTTSCRYTPGRRPPTNTNANALPAPLPRPAPSPLHPCHPESLPHKSPSLNCPNAVTSPADGGG